jgi:lipid A 4'-phosphatase
VTETDATPTMAHPANGDHPGKKMSFCFGTPMLWAPVVILAFATAVFRFTNADLAISSLFFAGRDSSHALSGCWPLKNVQPWKMLYDYGVYPAWILGVGGLLVWVVSFFWDRLRSWRDPGLFLALVLAIGPGLIVNGIFKTYWGRPRPHDTIPFGGDKEYLLIFQRGSEQDATSFSCGHASMGFYLMAPAFIFYRRSPRLAAAVLCLGLFAGFTIGMARIVQGSHFASDVIWSGGFVYFTGLVLSALFRFNVRKPPTPSKAIA